jgi:putative SOS response-associated peptidase YedK
MCNRFIPNFITLVRFRKLIASIPAFEEFVDKPRYKPSMEVGAPDGSVGSPPGSSALHDQPEARPTDRTPVIRIVSGELRIDPLKWGLVPPHETEPSVSYSTFNAKAETIRTTAAYAHAWKSRQRCLIPTQAFFEWKGAQSPKQKYRISMKDHSEFFLGGLWEKWERGVTILETITIITTVANELVAEIHDKKRMPVIIPPGDCDRWLRSAEDVTNVLKPYPSELMEAEAVSRKKSRRDEGPSLFPMDE